MNYNRFLFFLLSAFFIQKITNLTCKEEQIDNCLECGTGEYSDTCAKCENNYFPFLFNYLCLPCDHMTYGDSGCLGNCYIDNNLDVTCDEFGCKEGFYSIDKKTCQNCNSLNTPYCAKCTNLPPEGKTPAETDVRQFECQECINNEYKIGSDGKCHHCYIGNCLECHYPEGSNEAVCDRCKYNYYVRNGNTCIECIKKDISGGYCRVCTDDETDYEHIYCYCKKYYTQDTPRTCIHCPNFCDWCTYDQSLGRVRCLNCLSYSVLNSQGTCTYCGKGCVHCSLDFREDPVCSYCASGYDLIDGKCYDCPSGCSKCHLENDEFICDECFSSYAMNSEKNCIACPNYCNSCDFNTNGILKCTSCYPDDYFPYYQYYALNSDSLCEKCPDKCRGCFWKESAHEFGCTNCFSGYAFRNDDCLYCSTISELGEGCSTCYYSSSLQKFQCSSCKNDDYAWVSNSYECISNVDSSNKQLHGCLRATYNQQNGKYECNICKPEFIPILNDKNCRSPTDANLHSDCREANNIGTELSPIYSCLSCKHLLSFGNVNVTDYRGVNDCYESKDDLAFCLTATKDESGKLQCTKCVGNFRFIHSTTYEKDICDPNCDPGYFKKYFWCYKCDDRYSGNPGCVAEKGCEYISDNDQLNCNECKVGYFRYTYGQCFQCKEGSPPCLECHMNETANRFECDKCIDGYFVNNNKKCEVITCDEHPEVTPGCVICSDKLAQYKSEGKCQACKEGFFKTKDGTCIYCKSKKNGGPGCQICEYATDEQGNETDDIVCKYCPNGFLTSDGKCYRCQDELENGCRNCTLQVNEIQKTEKLICTNCSENYLLSNHSHCIHFNSYVEKIPFCAYQYNYLEKYNEQSSTTPTTTYPAIDDEENEFPSSDNNSKNEFKIFSTCEECKEGYVRDGEKICLPLEISNCSLSSLISFGTYEEYGDDYENQWGKYKRCYSMCSNSKYVKVQYYYEVIEEVRINNETKKNNTNETEFDEGKENEVETEMRAVKHRLYLDESLFTEGKELMQNSQIINIISKGYLCLSNLGTGGKYSPENLRKCAEAEYIESNDTYQCVSCIEGYSLDNEAKTCKQSIKVSMNLRPGFSNCYASLIGNYSNQLYSCYYCYDWNNLLVTSETGAKFCAPKEGELAGCTEAYANTTYLNNVYNCTSCDAGFISYYNIFFEKIICQNVHNKPDKIREIDSRTFTDVENVDAINGICESTKLFTPDGVKCYACNNRTVGMVGCKGSCTFNLRRNISLKCEDGKCKTGYIEKTQGVCEPCETINDGCIECHYENNYLNGYYGFKRKRRFSCDQCDNGYLRSDDGTCHHCSTLGFTNCKNCGIDTQHDNEIVCLECQFGYFVDAEGKCKQCYENQIKGKDNTCIRCDDVEGGGIEGCNYCKNVNNEPQCTQCKEGFILLENSYTCVRISSNAELEELTHCQIALFYNNHFVCSKCESNFILLEENNNVKCISLDFIPTFHPYFCELFVNLGTEDQPKYSCSKCSKVSEYKIQESITRITYQVNNTAYCEYTHEYPSIENCTEAIMIIENGVKKLNCTQCIEDNILHYHEDTGLNICKYKYFEKQCVVKYCKTCRPDNNYFCSQCLPSNYEVSPLTGACVRKTDNVPGVYWKDIFRLKMNQHKQIGARRFFGPFLSLRGLTSSQINTGHAFMVLMSFKLHYTRNNRNRNLEEEKSIKTYCQVVESMDETNDETNLVDFDCIGDTEENEDLSHYDLNSIKESEENNSQVFQGSNLDELAEKTDLQNLATKTKSTFELKNFLKLSTFALDEVKEIKSEDYHFDFTLTGKLDKDLAIRTMDIKLPLNKIKGKYVDCKFDIKEERKADLKCDLNLDEYKSEYTEFSFKATEIGTEDEPIFLARINDVKLVHEEKKKSYVVIIVIVVVIVVLAAAGVGVGIYLYKRKKNVDNNIDSNNNQNNNNANPVNIEKIDSEERVVNYENNNQKIQ